MSAQDNGGPAFPCDRIIQQEEAHSSPGMTLRDYFAAKAMAAMVSGHFSYYGHENYWDRESIADQAYELADAMLAARSNT